MRQLAAHALSFSMHRTACHDAEGRPDRANSNGQEGSVHVTLHAHSYDLTSHTMEWHYIHTRESGLECKQASDFTE